MEDALSWGSIIIIFYFSTGWLYCIKLQVAEN